MAIHKSVSQLSDNELGELNNLTHDCLASMQIYSHLDTGLDYQRLRERLLMLKDKINKEFDSRQHYSD